jgi:hypothetical protein
VEVEIKLVEVEEEALEGIEESELDEMWSYVGAIERLTVKVLAYAFGQRARLSISEAKKFIRAIWC